MERKKSLFKLLGGLFILALVVATMAGTAFADENEPLRLPPR